MRDWQLGLAIILLSACAEQVQSQLTVVPPAPIALPASAAAADGDADGVSDAADKCPGEKEDGEAPLPADGCAATDDDGDGVRVGDRCPQEKETPNGYQDEDGCPDEAPLAQFDGDQVKLRQRIAFGGFGLLSKESDPVLDAIAKLITEASDIGLVEVSGHLSGGRSMNRSAGANGGRRADQTRHCQNPPGRGRVWRQVHEGGQTQRTRKRSHRADSAPKRRKRYRLEGGMPLAPRARRRQTV